MFGTILSTASAGCEVTPQVEFVEALILFLHLCVQFSFLSRSVSFFLKNMFAVLMADHSDFSQSVCGF